MTKTIGSSVASIGSEAFKYCIGLKSITIPADVKKIGIYAFYGCSDNLTSVTFKNTSGWIAEAADSSNINWPFSSTELSNTATAARYVTSLYSKNRWNRS